jgi:hypothetical protein
MAPSNMPSAPGASCTSGDDSSSACVPRGTNATKGKYRGDTKRVVGLWKIGVDEVRLLSP